MVAAVDATGTVANSSVCSCSSCWICFFSWLSAASSLASSVSGVPKSTEPAVVDGWSRWRAPDGKQCFESGLDLRLRGVVPTLSPSWAPGRGWRSPRSTWSYGRKWETPGPSTNIYGQETGSNIPGALSTPRGGKTTTEYCAEIVVTAAEACTAVTAAVEAGTTVFWVWRVMRRALRVVGGWGFSWSMRCGMDICV